MTELLDYCPKCEGKAGWIKNDYWYGWAIKTGAWDGNDNVYPVFYDKMKCRRSKTAICMDCGKRIRLNEELC